MSDSTPATAASIDGEKLARYLDEWGATMTTAKARWAAEWAAETVRKALRDPSMLDRLPPAKNLGPEVLSSPPSQ